MWPRWEVRLRSASTALPSKPASCCRWPRARWSRSVACAGGAAVTCRWRAASSDPSGSGAAATDELTGLGAGPLAAGDLLHAGAWAPPLGDHLVWGCATELDPGAPVELRVLPGPHAEQFDPDALAQLTGGVFVVEPTSNRVGIRLRPEPGVFALTRPVWRGRPRLPGRRHRRGAGATGR